jgi:hypothetical protein
MNVIWYNKLKQYINKNTKLPSNSSKDDKIKQLGNWIQTQQKNYKNKTEIMKNEEIRKLWKEFIEEYKEYLKSNEEII